MIKLAINGYGRIGRCVLRALYESGARSAMQVVAINEPADLATIAHLSKYDSTHGRFGCEVGHDDSASTLTVDGDVIAVSHCEKLEDLPWAEFDIDIVLECSGVVDAAADLDRHLQAGAGRVLLSQPGQPEIKAIVRGVNDALLVADDRIASAASCTSNCIVPVIAVLDDRFVIESGVITTIHSVMNDQPGLDGYHHSDLRKTRAASQSIIPIDTGLAEGIGRVLPAMQDKFAARHLRVPTTNVSAIELTVAVAEAADVEAVNNALRAAASSELIGLLGVTDEPLASCDFIHDPHSGVVDAGQTRVSGNLITVLVWFDSEWAYANRMLELASRWAV